MLGFFLYIIVFILVCIDCFQDKMIDMFKTEGKFPSSIPGHNFEGPIRSHYRPRRLWTMLVILISSFLTLPPVFHAFYSLFCSGILNVVFGVILLGLGNMKVNCLC